MYITVYGVTLGNLAANCVAIPFSPRNITTISIVVYLVSTCYVEHVKQCDFPSRSFEILIYITHSSIETFKTIFVFSPLSKFSGA